MEDIQFDKLSITSIVNSFKNSNTYIVAKEGFDSVWLVDVGDADKILDIIDVKTIAGIFITHAHLDHIYGLQQICDKFPNCIVYGSDLGMHYLFDDKKNLSFYYERPLNLLLHNNRSLKDGEKVLIFDREYIQCIYTPGHTRDSVCYQLNTAIFTGDAYIPGIPIVTKLRGGDKHQASNSLQIIKDKITDGCIIYPGHFVK